MRCEFLTAVWGPWHTSVFLELAIPSLLSAGNFPDFGRRVRCSYWIHTTSEDAKVIESSEAIAALRKLMAVKVVVHPRKLFGDPVETHTRIWLDGVTRAKEREAFISPLPADMVWADGSMRSVADSLERGKKAIYAMFVRVVSETFVQDFPQVSRVGNDGVATTIAPRELVGMMLRHIHPLHASYLRDSSHFPFHPEYVLWPAGKDGFLMRALATTALMFHAGEYAVNSQFSLSDFSKPEEVEFFSDSDAMCGVSLTPLLKDADWYFEERRADLEEIGAWWITFDGPAHEGLARHRYRFHTGIESEDCWRKIEAQSDFFVHQARIAREMVRVGRALRACDCYDAARLLGTALYSGRLRRHWRWGAPVTVLAPSDEAYAASTSESVPDDILRRGDSTRLREYLFAHVALERIDFRRSSSVTSLAGSRLDIERAGNEIRVNGALVTHVESLFGGSQVCVLDRPLSV